MLCLHVAVYVLVKRQAEDPALVAVFPRRQVEALCTKLIAGVVLDFLLHDFEDFHLSELQTERALRLPLLCLPVLCEVLQRVVAAEPGLFLGDEHCFHYGLVVCVVPAEKVPAVVVVIVPLGEVERAAVNRPAGAFYGSLDDLRLVFHGFASFF